MAASLVELGGVQSLRQAYPEHNPLEPPGFSVQVLAPGRRGDPVANTGRPGERAFEIPPPCAVHVRVRSGARAPPVEPAPIAEVVAARLAPVGDLVPGQAGLREQVVGQFVAPRERVVVGRRDLTRAYARV